MNKGILASSVSLALAVFSCQLIAQEVNEVVVNGAVVSGVSVKGFNYNVDTQSLHITTSNSSQVLVISDGGTTDPDTTDPDTTDPDTTDPDTTDPDTTDPENTDSDVYVKYSIQDMLDASGYIDMSIAGGKTLASGFTVPTDAIFQGAEFKLQNITNNRTRAWISTEPGGSSVTGCELTSSFTYRVEFSVPTGNKACKLSKGATYYLNLKNVDSNTKKAAVTRQMTTVLENAEADFDWSFFL